MNPALAEAEQIVLLVQTGTDEGRYNEDMAQEVATTLARFRLDSMPVDDEIPPNVRNGGRSAGEQTQTPQPSVRSGGQQVLHPHSIQYVVERGSGSTGTAYNKRDHEVIDLERKPGSRVIARATCLDAELICRALNAFGGE
jgi:hypothetical protein